MTMVTFPINMIVWDNLVVSTSAYPISSKATFFVLHFSTSLTKSKVAPGLFKVLTFHVPLDDSDNNSKRTVQHQLTWNTMMMMMMMDA